MFGYFYTLNERKEVVCVNEEFSMKWFKDGKSISGSIEGDVHKEDGTFVSRRWIFKGVRHGNDLSLYYITDGPAPTGAGVYYLPSRGGSYEGYWLGLDFPTDLRVQCPYILVDETQRMRASEKCEQKWPKTFNEDNTCKILR